MIDGQAQNSDGKVMLFRIMLTPVSRVSSKPAGKGRIKTSSFLIPG